MESRKDFLIPIGGLSLGDHQFEIDIDDTFVTKYEGNLDAEMSMDCEIQLTKASSYIKLGLSIKGWLQSACDRCLAQIEIPVDFSYKVMVKYDDEYKDDGDVIYLPRSQSELDIEEIVFDAARLALPKRRVINCEENENRPCDMAVLNKLDKIEVRSSSGDIWKEIKSEIQNK